ncbi:MAG: EAL domain-containing protein [Zoogloeaceae bacterium]|jgi:diguanylate cyclase (GGDEF)-like protein/PAS domain S-box-containing protein|nr:EAL domain-containing protein [Zoogloeaceae bacterium]
MNIILLLALICIVPLCLVYHARYRAQHKQYLRVNHCFDAAFYNFPGAVCIIKLGDDTSGDIIVDGNRALEQLMGWSRDEMADSTVDSHHAWHNQEQRRDFLTQLREKGEILRFPAEMLDRDKTLHYLYLTAKVFDLEGEPHFIVLFGDRSVQRKTEERARMEGLRYRALYEGMIDGYCRCNKNGYFIESNRAFREPLGYTEEELWRLTPRDITPTRQHAEDARIEQELRERGSCKLYEKEQIRKDGSTFPVELQLYVSLDDQGEFDGWWAIIRDLSKTKRDQANLDFLAYHDPTTGLPNRTLLQDRLEHALERARRDQQQLALLFIDLDRFKHVNDTLGYHVGDALLQVVARSMGALLRDSDTLARLSGDEFMILLEENATTANVTMVADRILAMFAKPQILQDQEIYITASIGVSIFPQDGDSVDILMKYAELAMFKAKDQGRNIYQFFESGLSVGALERLALENGLRSVVSRGELVLHYQPQINLLTGHLIGVEALVRWQNPGLGLVMPDRFIHIAEDIGIISDIGAWVLQEACRQMAAWQKKGLHVPRIAVNLSVQQLERTDLVSLVQRQLEVSGLKPQQLELEVTESMLMRQTGRALEILNALESMGVYLAVDDFGTGYSSFGYLKRLPVHRLKIDYSFIRDIGQDANDEAITRAIIALSDSLGLEVVAEGVEREEQETFLRREGCHLVQGFRYDKGLPAKDLLSKYMKVVT